MTESAILIQGPILPEFTAAILAKLQENQTIGAQALFLGQVRADVHEGRQVIGIEYSAYIEMIDQSVRNIKNLLHNRYPQVTGISIFHSVGLVQAGEISLLVVVSCAHRLEAFSALADCVEQIKIDLPVWKKERFEDGSHRWLES